MAGSMCYYLALAKYGIDDSVMFMNIIAESILSRPATDHACELIAELANRRTAVRQISAEQ
jgi:hypothetical protein